MRRRNVVPLRSLVPVLMSCTVLLACGKGKEPVDTAKAPPPAAVAPAPVAQALPGTLPKALDSLSGNELYDFTRKLGYGGGVDKDRTCTGSSECNGTKPMKTKVRLDAVDGQDSSLSAVNVPTTGVIAVRAINQGAFTEKYYKMKAGKNIEYYLVVLPGSQTAGRWRLEQLNTTEGARSHSQVATGTFNSCGHPFSKKAIRTNFQTCSDAKAASDSTSRSGLALQGDNDPIWVTCSGGCCTGTTP